LYNITLQTLAPLLNLLNIVGVVKSYALKKFLVKSDRGRQMVDAAQPLGSYGQEYSRNLLIFTISMAYSTIAPLITVFAALFFSFGWLQARYAAIYVSVPNWEAGGRQ
jgi:hypothetical protein